MENLNRNRCSNNEVSFVSGVFKHRIEDRAELRKALEWVRDNQRTVTPTLADPLILLRLDALPANECAFVSGNQLTPIEI